MWMDACALERRLFLCLNAEDRGWSVSLENPGLPRSCVELVPMYDFNARTPKPMKLLGIRG